MADLLPFHKSFKRIWFALEDGVDTFTVLLFAASLAELVSEHYRGDRGSRFREHALKQYQVNCATRHWVPASLGMMWHDAGLSRRMF